MKTNENEFYIKCESPNGDKIWNQKPFMGTRKALYDSWRKGHFSEYRYFCLDNPGSIITINGKRVKWCIGRMENLENIKSNRELNPIARG